jgi:heterodisulfide reductase subunit C
MSKYQTDSEKQCLYCGFVPVAVDAGFNVKKLLTYAKKGEVEYSWTCCECYRENYYKKKENPESLYALLEQFARFYPELRKKVN